LKGFLLPASPDFNNLHFGYHTSRKKPVDTSPVHTYNVFRLRR
jgi:hypothetical protein